MDSDFVKVSIENISLFNYNFMVLLKPEDDDKVLPICIGHAEAHSIAAAYNNHKFPRPLTHDLMKNVLSELDCTLSKIQVTEIKDGTFILPEHLIDDLERFKVGKAKLKGSKKVKMQETQDKLKTFPKKKLDKKELKESEI